jgi:TPR repeat protein
VLNVSARQDIDCVPPVIGNGRRRCACSGRARAALWPCGSVLALLLLSDPICAQPAGDATESTAVILTDSALLAPQPEPDCAFRTDDPNATERQQLDFERQCYRHAEMIVRNRLEMLQDAIKQRATVTPSRAPAAAASTSTPPKDIDAAQRLVELGDRHMSQGNVAIAREYYGRAADLGLAAAALKMAETQDPKELARFNVRGVKPDLAEAKRWYQRALELKASEAEARLRRLREP